MEKEKVILVGSGQHFHVVKYNLDMQNKYEVVCALDADPAKWGTLIDGIVVEGGYDNLDAIREKHGTNKFFIAFGNMKYRREVYMHFVKNGWEAITIIHPQAVVSPDAIIGKGVLIECGCLITPNPVIGNNVVVNTGSQVNHDNVVEDHVYIASGVILSGGVRVKENTLLDDGVIVTLGREVGKNCIVGAGAVVTQNLGDNHIIYGVPAKVVRENQ